MDSCLHAIACTQSKRVLRPKLMANPFEPAQKLDNRKRLAAIATGALVGAGMAIAIGALFAVIGGIALVGSAALLGALAGGVLGEAIASRVDMGPWEPLTAGRSYVGAHAPDDGGG
jgi:hypothetical protein